MCSAMTCRFAFVSQQKQLCAFEDGEVSFLAILFHFILFSPVSHSQMTNCSIALMHCLLFIAHINVSNFKCFFRAECGPNVEQNKVHSKTTTPLQVLTTFASMCYDTPLHNSATLTCVTFSSHQRGTSSYCTLTMSPVCTVCCGCQMMQRCSVKVVNLQQWLSKWSVWMTGKAWAQDFISGFDSFIHLFIKIIILIIFRTKNQIRRNQNDHVTSFPVMLHKTTRQLEITSCQSNASYFIAHEFSRCLSLK